MPRESAQRRVEVLVLCIDRDDDLGKKAAIRGPIIGEAENFKAANALAMADPEDSDVNAIFAAIKTKRESEHLYHEGAEVVTLTGDKQVGVKSDQKIGNQLVRVLEAYKPRGIILVTDGAEDEEIIPLIQSETKILSIKTVNVKLARPLESAYFKIQDFFRKVGENPAQAKTMFGLPGILIFMIVLLSYFGIPIVEVIFALIGVYLIAKGFGYDEQLFSGLSEVRGSLLRGNIYRVFNLLAVLVLILSLVTGYLQVQRNLDAIYRPNTIANPTSVGDAFGSQPILALNFMLFASGGSEMAAIDLLIIALSIMAIGFIIHNFLLKNYLRIKHYVNLIIIGVLVKYVSASLYWFIIDFHYQRDATTILVEGFDPMQNLLINLLIAFVVLLVSHYLLKIVFFDYVERKKQLQNRYIGREVISKRGKKLGKVTKIVMRGDELKGINIKRKYYDAKDMHIKGNVLVVKE